MSKNEATINNSRASLGNTKTMVKMGMLAAVSIVMVYLVRFPIFPAVYFLEYDPADIPILIGTFVFGTPAGLLLTVVISIIQGFTVSSSSGIYGIIMHIIATSTLVLVSGAIYQKHKTRKFAVISMTNGIIAMALAMIAANLIITPLFMGVPRNTVWSLMPFIISFNVIKAGINSLMTFIIYKRVSSFLRR